MHRFTEMSESEVECQGKCCSQWYLNVEEPRGTDRFFSPLRDSCPPPAAAHCPHGNGSPTQPRSRCRPLPLCLASHTYTALWKVPAACISGPEGLFQNSGMLFCQQGCAEELIFPKSSLQPESDKDWCRKTPGSLIFLFR